MTDCPDATFWIGANVNKLEENMNRVDWLNFVVFVGVALGLADILLFLILLK